MLPNLIESIVANKQNTFYNIVDEMPAKNPRPCSSKWSLPITSLQNPHQMANANARTKSLHQMKPQNNNGRAANPNMNPDNQKFVFPLYFQYVVNAPAMAP